MSNEIDKKQVKKDLEAWYVLLSRAHKNMEIALMKIKEAHEQMQKLSADIARIYQEIA